LLLLGFITPLFADDALMIPENVIRFRVIPSATFTSQYFDPDGDREDGVVSDAGAVADGATQYNLSFALEYGVTDWITAALQWTPGWNFATTLDEPVAVQPFGNDNIVVKGLNDLFIGAKVQIIGENAPVPNEQHRFAIAAGAIAPLSTYDAEEEQENLIAGDDFRPLRTGRDVWGFGARLYYDFVVNESFFINLYNETIFYPEQERETILNPDGSDYAYGYKATFELEPQYETMISDGVRFSAGLPLIFLTTPEIEIDGTAVDDSESYTFSVGPNVSFFLLDAPWPIDLELQYRADLFGKNAQVQNSVVLQIKNYLRFW
jgi:hypothetical protein